MTGQLPQLDDESVAGRQYRIGDVVNQILRAGLTKDSRRIIFGEDIEDPKGGVFRLTQKLSSEFPDQVFNSPLAESTILGVACGLASYGKRPVFELQFIDFINPGWNQLATNLSTLRWRSFGTWTCPLVIYAPYGAYLPAAVSGIARRLRLPSPLAGIHKIAIRATGGRCGAALDRDALRRSDLYLIPKHLLWAEHESEEPIRAVSLGKARVHQPGADGTVVAWATRWRNRSRRSPGGRGKRASS